MSYIGSIEKILNTGVTEYWGYLSTLELDIKFVIRENEDQRSPNSPTHLIIAKSKNGSEVQIGNAWLRTPKALSTGAYEFFSLTFDDPSFNKPLNVAAFTENEKI